MEGRAVFLFICKMDRTELENVAERAALDRGCKVVAIDFNDDDNIFEVTIDREVGNVDLADCEHVHRAILDAFDRNIEDYALTVGSLGIDAEEADEILGTINE